MNNFRSDISNAEFPIADRVSAKLLRPSLLASIQKDHPEFTADKHLSISELAYYREKYVSDCLIKDIGELTELEHTVINAYKNKSTITDKLENEEEPPQTVGQRIADNVAAFGGSWTFIIMFCSFIFLWIFANIVLLTNKGFDPYPFILLNLILSCVAALQAPVIMMSQNRQEEKDRDRARKDYMINLKSELEIRILHEKIDHLIMHQQQELLEIQKVQTEMMSEILKKVQGTGN